jgi:HemY protein
VRSLLWILVLAALAVGLSLMDTWHEAYALFVTPGWRMEIALDRFLMILLIAFILLYWTLRLLFMAFALPSRIRRYRMRAKKERASHALAQAMHRLLEGRYSQSIKAAEQAWTDGAHPGIAALLAWRAAHALRDDARSTLWRERAVFSGPDVHVARLITQAELALERREVSAAREAMDQLTSAERRHIAALRLDLRIEQGLGHWPQVLRLVRLLERNKALTADQAHVLRLRAHREVMSHMSDAAQLKSYWQALPGDARRDADLVEKLVRAHNEQGLHAQAARLLEDHLDTCWDARLVAEYPHCAASDEAADALIARAEAWLNRYPHEATLLRVLGQLCARRQLWGKAQSYLEASLAVAPSQRAHLELAHLLDQRGQATQANHHYRAAAHLERHA